MVQLADVQRQAKELSEEDRKGLVAYLLHGFSGMPLGPDDDEIDKRDTEMDSGAISPISHDEFLRQIGRRQG
jgi:transcriptional regulator of met regulon